jgi:hypothetical protein
MKAYAEQVVLEPITSETSRNVSPVIDDAIAALPAADRELVLLRFFHGRSFREIGSLVGKSDDAAQKQCERALSKLARVLARAGITLPVHALAGTLTPGLVPSAPVGLAASISAGALSGASMIGVKTVAFKTLNLMATTKTKVAVGVALIAAIPLLWQSQEIRRLQRELAGAKESIGTGGSDGSRRARIPAFDPSRTSRASHGVGSSSTASPATALSLATMWEQALLEPDPIRRMQRISELLAGLTADAAPAVAEVFLRMKQGGSNQETEYGLFLRSWGRIDGASAVAFALAHTKKALASAELGAALAGWASTSPEAARDWAEAQPEGEAKETALYGLLDGWSLLDFDAAAAYAATRPRSPARNQFRELLLERSLAAGGMPEAQRWFASIPDDEHNQLYKQRALDEVIHAMLYRDPSAAAQWIQQIGDGRLLDGNAVEQVAGKLAQSAPLEALQWLNSLSSVKSEQRNSGLRATMDQWVKSDPNAAGAWLQQHASDDGYDTMAGAYAQNIAPSDVKSAVAWAQSVRNDEERSKSIAAIVEATRRTAGAGADDQLRNAGLSDTEIAPARFGVAGLFDHVAGQWAGEKLGYAIALDSANRIFHSAGGGSGAAFGGGSGAPDLTRELQVELQATQDRATLAEKLQADQLDLAVARAQAAAQLERAQAETAIAEAAEAQARLAREAGGGVSEGASGGGGGGPAVSSASRIDLGSWQRFLSAHDPKSLNPDCRSCHQQ